MALRKAFKYFDTDASGDIDPDEFFSAMHAFGLEFTEDQVLALFGHYDTDRDGGLSYYEFIEKVLESDFYKQDPEDSSPHKKKTAVLAPLPLEDEVVKVKSVLTDKDLDIEHTRRVFHKFDANDSGEIDMRELGYLVKGLGLNLQMEELSNAMLDLDKDKNGAISFEEFWNWFQSAAVVKSTSGGLKTGMLKAKQSLRSAADLNRIQVRTNELDQNGRPMSAMSGRSSGRKSVGSWVSRNHGASPSPGLMARPMSAMERGSTGRLTYTPGPGGGGSKRKPYGSSSWRSVSRSDFRPPSAGD